jgi:hypothetical protein
MRATWIADACRAYGAVVVEDPGWQSRGADLVACQGIVFHHTASNPGSDPGGDIHYIWHSTSNGLVPEYSIYISRSATVYVGCAGKTNNAGEGGNNANPNTCGRVPIPWCPGNSANGYGLSVVLANNGTGEPYPAVQQDAAIATLAALCDFGSIPVANIAAHQEWTKRKIDPAGNSRYATNAAMWNMDQVRADVAATITNGGQDLTDEQDAMLRDVQRRLIEIQGVMYTPGPFLDDGGNPMNPSWAAMWAAERARQIRDG